MILAKDRKGEDEEMREDPHVPVQEVAILFFAYSLVIGFLYALPGDLV